MLKRVISRLLNWNSTRAWTWQKQVSEQRLLSPEERKSRGVTAQQLLENPVLIQALEGLEADLLNQMRQVSLSDRDAHTRLVMGLQTNHAVRRHLWLIIQDGHSAVEQIQLRGKRID